MKRYVVADIHGGARALKQVLNIVEFDKKNDQLICLGDICDGYSEVYEAVEELLSIKNLIFVMGNHDEPFLDFLNTGIHSWKWKQGGEGTLKSYINNYPGEDRHMTKTFFNGDHGPGFVTDLLPEDIPLTHHNFFKSAIPYYVDEGNNLFIHGGFNRHFHLNEQNPAFFMWDRDLWYAALSYQSIIDQIDPADNPHGKFKIKDNFNKIFIGHTATTNWKVRDHPMKAANIINLDQGAGFNGRLTLYCLDDDTFVQSDIMEQLYVDDYGRRRRGG